MRINIALVLSVSLVLIPAAWPAMSGGSLMAAIKGPVQTAGGFVEGVPGTDPSIVSYKGIPYAAPPVGGLRWRPPQPPAVWSGIRKADRFGASCIQNIVTERKPWTYEFMAHNEISEDCLSLNVWTSAGSPADKRPVFFWIHGGGNNEGSSAVPVYDGEGLAKKGLVVVVINYRLGVLGWFTHPDLTRESGHQASGNYGLMDQIAALKWVRDNIAAFGGDPNRVTIAGQSAGASAVHNLVVSPLASGLFHRAIAESGSGITSRSRPLAEQEQDGLKLAQAKGARTLADLRAMSWQDLISPPKGVVPDAATGATATWRFGVVIDGYTLPAPHLQVIAAGKHNDVPMLTGCNAHENGAVPRPEVTLESFPKQVKQRYSEMAEDFMKLYPAASNEEAARAFNEGARDQARVSMYIWALQRAKTSKTKTFTYFWNHPLPGPEVEKYGAFHTSEVPYVLNTLGKSDRPFTVADRQVAETMSSYWVNFASAGDPNGNTLPQWLPVSSKEARTMQVGDQPGPIPVSGNSAKIEFFKQYLARPRTSPRP